MKVKRIFNRLITALIILAVLAAIAAGAVLALQKYYAHISEPFTPYYERVELTKNTNHQIIFLQTGLGKPVVEKLIEEDRFDEILKAQDIFFTSPDVKCREMIGHFTMEDVLASGERVPFYDLRAGDILVTLSTHSAGWRHGHAALVITDDILLECRQLGTKSSFEDLDYWEDYSNYAVLRVKGASAELGETVKNYSMENLCRVPYNLLSGVIGPKAPPADSKTFGLYCTNLMWYAWYQQGIDLDSDGGKIVTANDLLHSENVEIVQLFGMDPTEFID